MINETVRSWERNYGWARQSNHLWLLFLMINAIIEMSLYQEMKLMSQVDVGKEVSSDSFFDAVVESEAEAQEAL